VNAERWRQIDELFNLALESPPDERGAFVCDWAGEDSELRREVESLLEAAERADGFPLIRFPVRRGYALGQIAEALSSAIDPSDRVAPPIAPSRRKEPRRVPG
jgi:hypothetical protein